MRQTILDSEGGNVSIIFAFSLLTILMLIGLAVDGARVLKVNNDMQNAADSAALAGAIAYPNSSLSGMKAEGRIVFDANTASNLDVKVREFQINKSDNNTVKVSANVEVTPYFAQMFGHSKLNVSVKSTASLGEGEGIEVAFAMDSTTSMTRNGAWDDAIDTVENILEDMQNLTGEENFYVTLIPFSDRVNVGRVGRRWIDRSAGFKPNRWSGCLEPREEKKGEYSWMLDDDRPQRRNRFTPTDRMAKFSTGEAIVCPTVPITGPTNVVSDISEGIRNISPSGSGRFDVGLAWAWRSVSPNWRNYWGIRSYPSRPTDRAKGKSQRPRKKYIVYMTDGRTEAYFNESMYERSWGWNNGSKQALEHFVELCEDVKEQGIEIYMLQVPGNAHSTSFLKQCASSDQHYTLVDEPKDIALAFTDIKNTLYSGVRIVE